MASLEEFGHLKIKLEDIKSATNDFDESQLIGNGGYGKVYKGELPQFKDGCMAAFKRLDPQNGQGDTEFKKEIMTLARYKHGNIISLLGFCDEDNEKVLVYELASRGSLDHHLPSATVTWTQRLKICLAASKGLNFIHDADGKYQRVIHCDIKSANILLDDNWNAKVSDFGLSEMAPANQQYSAVIKNPSGTHGYVDPALLNTNTLMKESDVYSFGVVLFEVLCGTLCCTYNNGHLIQDLVPDWKKTQENKNLNNFILEGLIKQQRDPSALKTFLDIAYRCLRDSPKERPTMADVVVELEIQLDFAEEQEIAYGDVPMESTDQEEKLNARLSNGILVNGGNTWLSVNKNLKHCEMISIAECLVDYKSRFSGGFYEPSKLIFTTHVRTRFLSPGTPYTVNLVFKNKKPKERYIGLEYKIKDGKKSYSFLADERKDAWLSAELYQLTSDGRAVDLEILFDCQHCPTLLVEGIEFQPQEEDQNVETQPILDPDTYWNENLPSDDKDRENCLMLATRAALKDNRWRWKSLPKTRFEATRNSSRKFDISCDIKLNTLPRETTYATYLVYKQEGDYSIQPGPAHVRDKESVTKDIRHIYLQTPQTPVIGKNVDKNTYNTSHRPKIKGLPKQRSDDWMEVPIWEFRTTNKNILVRLELFSYDDSLEGIEVQGIEFRPV
ncbi:tyrosine-protein kinase receptor TYRO3-like protein [Tanacetum coccineum]